jgi:hypothetical protein
METKPLSEKTNGSDSANQPSVERDYVSDSANYETKAHNVISDGDDGLLAPSSIYVWPLNLCCHLALY